jgi:hypothetical protein
MSTSLLLGICAALYFFTVFTYLPARPGMAVAFFGYFLANGGLSMTQSRAENCEACAHSEKVYNEGPGVTRTFIHAYKCKLQPSYYYRVECNLPGQFKKSAGK